MASRKITRKRSTGTTSRKSSSPLTGSDLRKVHGGKATKKKTTKKKATYK